MVRSSCSILFITLSLFSFNSFAVIDLACQKDCLSRGYESNYCSQSCSYNPISKNATDEGFTPEAQWDSLSKSLKQNKELKLPTQEGLPQQQDYLRTITVPKK